MKFVGDFFVLTINTDLLWLVEPDVLDRAPQMCTGRRDGIERLPFPEYIEPFVFQECNSIGQLMRHPHFESAGWLIRNVRDKGAE